jgi:cell division protein FtsZ
MDGARGVLLSIAGGSDLGLFEINDAAQLVTDAAHPDANIIFGAVIDDALGDEVRVTVIAAGFDGGTPAYKPADMARRAVPPHLLETSTPIQVNPPLGSTIRTPVGAQSARRVLFDDVDVPDFLKNGS